MTLTCTSRYGGHGARCQDRQHPNGLHHGHTDDQCLQWADGGVHFAKPISSCPWPPAHEVARRAEELGPKIKARRERPTAVAVEHPDDELLRAEIERLRYEENRQIGLVNLDAVRSRADEHAEHQARMGWSCCRSHASADDVPALLAENQRLRAELAAARTSIPVDDLARILCDADVFVTRGSSPGWDDLPEDPGHVRAQIRKTARYLLRRLNINPHQPPTKES